MSTGKTKKLVIVLWCDTKCCHRDEELFESLDHWLQQPEDQQIIDHTTSEQYRSAMTQECADAPSTSSSVSTRWTEWLV